jgi:hypothetical protein
MSGTVAERKRLLRVTAFFALWAISSIEITDDNMAAENPTQKYGSFDPELKKQKISGLENARHLRQNICIVW